MKKVFMYVGITLILIIFVVAGFFWYTSWRVKTGRLVYWDGKWYTKEEIRAKVGPQVYSVASKNTPEEVYTKFREALLKGNTEGALNNIIESERESYREAFKNKEKFDKWIKTLPEKIENIRINGNYGFYDWDKGDGAAHTIDFSKNEQGYWIIDSI